MRTRLLATTQNACGIISALPERDITAAILIVPLGIYAIFTKKDLSNYEE